MDSLVIGALVGLSISTCKLLRTPDVPDKHLAVISMLLLLLIALTFLETIIWTIWIILTASLFYRFCIDSPNIMLKIRDKLEDILMKISEKLKTYVPKAWIPQQNKGRDMPDWPKSPIPRFQSNPILIPRFQSNPIPIPVQSDSTVHCEEKKNKLERKRDKTTQREQNSKASPPACALHRLLCRLLHCAQCGATDSPGPKVHLTEQIGGETAAVREFRHDRRQDD